MAFVDHHDHDGAIYLLQIGVVFLPATAYMATTPPKLHLWWSQLSAQRGPVSPPGEDVSNVHPLKKSPQRVKLQEQPSTRILSTIRNTTPHTTLTTQGNFSAGRLDYTTFGRSHKKVTPKKQKHVALVLAFCPTSRQNTIPPFYEPTGKRPPLREHHPPPPRKETPTSHNQWNISRNLAYQLVTSLLQQSLI